MVAISVTNVSDATMRVTFSISDLSTSAYYDVVRVIEGGDDNERKYQLVGSYRQWQPGATTVQIVDTEAPIRPYRLAIWDSTGVTPLDFDFSSGGYTGPAALATSSVVALTAPDCGAILRSTKEAGLYAEVRIAEVSPMEYRLKASEMSPMGTRYPVIIADRREGRRVESVVLYAQNTTEAQALMDLLLPENGRVYPLWFRTESSNRLLFSDMLFMPMEITVEAASKARPERKFFTIQCVEVDPRLLTYGVG